MRQCSSRAEGRAEYLVGRLNWQRVLRWIERWPEWDERSMV